MINQMETYESNFDVFADFNGLTTVGLNMISLTWLCMEYTVSLPADSLIVSDPVFNLLSLVGWTHLPCWQGHRTDCSCFSDGHFHEELAATSFRSGSGGLRWWPA